VVDNMEKLTDQEQIRLDKVNELIKMGVDPFGKRFEVENHSADLFEKYGNLSKEELAEMNISASVAGRIMTNRNQGKTGFMHIQDNDGKIQIYLKSDNLTESEFEIYSKADIGDIVGIKGTVFKTKTDELSIKASEYTHLTKALKPLPEKFHGLTDDEIKFRKRYLDIIMNDDVKDIFLKKQIFWSTIRNFLVEKGFLEVETPILEVLSGGAAATPFKTHHNALDLDVFLRISMGELWQKKLLVAGFEKTFEIGRQFRNEGMSPEHLQDYTQMELYWAYADYKDGMQLVKEMFRVVTKAVMGSSKFTYRDFVVDVDQEWEILDFEKLIKDKMAIDIYNASEKDIEKKLDSLNIEYEPKLGYWRLVDILWKVVRKDLTGPAFLVGQPVQLNPLPKRDPDDPRKVAQMQVIMAGTEMGNGYTELNDPIDLEARFKEQRAMSESGDEEAHAYDDDFIEALKYGMPPAYGFGVSERFFAYLMSKPMRECVIFPLMKPLSQKETEEE